MAAVDEEAELTHRRGSKSSAPLSPRALAAANEAFTRLQVRPGESENQIPLEAAATYSSTDRAPYAWLRGPLRRPRMEFPFPGPLAVPRLRTTRTTIFTLTAGAPGCRRCTEAR
jgi:hypothetical protein